MFLEVPSYPLIFYLFLIQLFSTAVLAWSHFMTSDLKNDLFQ